MGRYLFPIPLNKNEVFFSPIILNLYQLSFFNDKIEFYGKQLFNQYQLEQTALGFQELFLEIDQQLFAIPMIYE